jgi:hypothetical protein
MENLTGRKHLFSASTPVTFSTGDANCPVLKVPDQFRLNEYLNLTIQFWSDRLRLGESVFSSAHSEGPFQRLKCRLIIARVREIQALIQALMTRHVPQMSFVTAYQYIRLKVVNDYENNPFDSKDAQHRTLLSSVSDEGGGPPQHRAG